MSETLLQKIYNATDNGLDIIYYYYPQAREVAGKQKFFKIRGNEKTASASMKMFSGVWKVTDFGDDGAAVSPIEICMREEKLEFREALFRLAERYGVSETINSVINKPIIEQRDAAPEEQEGLFTFKLKEKLSEFELKVLGPMVNQATCDKYSYYAVESYSKTKNRKTTTISSTDTYPIFMRDCGTFRKIYQPLNPDKAFRFFYDGPKPRDYINGMDELREEYKKYLDNLQKEEEMEYDEEKAGNKKPKKPQKLPEAIFCSGERDALNVAGMGYLPLWLNSETARLLGKDYTDISRMVERIYNIPDIDDTGIRKGIEFALDHIDSFTIELPLWLRTYKDNRSKPRKDLRDFIELRPSLFEFKELVKMAKPCKFWEISYTKEGIRHEINTVYLLHFLKTNGFGKITDVENGKITYIRIVDYKLQEITGRQIRGFIMKFLSDNHIDHEIQNLVLNSKRTGVSLMDDLEDFFPEFCDYSPTSQTFFFQNTAVKVYEDRIEETRGKDVGVSTWERDIPKHNFKRIEPAFKAMYDPDTGNVNLEIKHIKSHYFRFLINASRIFWREEFEKRLNPDPEINKQFRKEYKFAIASPRLTEEENIEQMQHLINKMFTIGYLLHRYKSPSKALGVWVMENKLTEEDESSGGSGKSFMINFLGNLCRRCNLDGRNRKLTENQFFLDRVDDYTDILCIDDAHRYFDFNYFYSMITGSTIVNYKQLKSKEIDFESSPKIVITSNYPPRDNDSSTMRRLLMNVFSDYYHKATADNDYLETRLIADDFGYDLHRDRYSEDFWNEDFNFCIDCLQFYLSTIKHNLVLQPPMENVSKRINIHKMGDEFMSWAEVYFSKDSFNVNKVLDKTLVRENFDPKRKFSSKQFTARLRAFCANMEHIEEYNPRQVQGHDGKRIVRTVNGETREFIYIKTYGIDINNEF